MDEIERSRLMHAVLDGAATADEAARLERLLHDDPAARDEFDELRDLFDGLDHLVQPPLPMGFADRVMAALPGSNARHNGLRQLFFRRRVIGPIAAAPARRVQADRSGGVRRTQPANASFWGSYGGDSMSERTSSSFGKRSLWIGGGIAAVAVVLAMSSWIDFPSTNKDTVGTVVPAQRYRAPQNAADDMKPGSDSSAQSSAASQTGGAATAATQNAVDAASANARASAATNAVDAAAQNARASATQNAVDAAAVNARNSATMNAVDAASANARNSASQNAVSGAAQNAVSGATQNAVSNATQNAVSGARQNAVAR